MPWGLPTVACRRLKPFPSETKSRSTSTPAFSLRKTKSSIWHWGILGWRYTVLKWRTSAEAKVSLRLTLLHIVTVKFSSITEQVKFVVAKQHIKGPCLCADFAPEHTLLPWLLTVKHSGMLLKPQRREKMPALPKSLRLPSRWANTRAEHWTHCSFCSWALYQARHHCRCCYSRY